MIEQGHALPVALFITDTTSPTLLFEYPYDEETDQRCGLWMELCDKQGEHVFADTCQLYLPFEIGANEFARLTDDSVFGENVEAKGNATPSGRWNNLYQTGYCRFIHCHGPQLSEVLELWSNFLALEEWAIGENGVVGKSEKFKDADTEEQSHSVTFNNATLQTFSIRRLQRQLAEHVLCFVREITKQESLHETTHNYVEALRCQDEVSKYQRLGPDAGPFLVSTESWIDRAVIHDTVYRLHSQSWPENMPLDKNLDVTFHYRTSANTLTDTKGLSRRIGMAARGGTLLIALMLIMVLHQSLLMKLLTKLLTTWICVYFFSLVVTLSLGHSFNVLSVTVASTAVLVVFVGTSGSGL
ncbi:hypothetical protein BJ878DRAFT_571747 [Calycina marina]|uniref:Uncharacterized protein n=1 Tax=Calycina marina TaxID=1763456 RepID=A0A9P7ZCC9_9HELO|nr:hypothetical protein BJ878DRAFT_571747 [Calycina marina]